MLELLVMLQSHPGFTAVSLYPGGIGVGPAWPAARHPRFIVDVFQGLPSLRRMSVLPLSEELAVRLPAGGPFIFSPLRGRGKAPPVYVVQGEVCIATYQVTLVLI